MNVNPRVNLAHNERTYERKREKLLDTWRQYKRFHYTLDDQMDDLEESYDQTGERRDEIEYLIIDLYIYIYTPHVNKT